MISVVMLQGLLVQYWGILVVVLGAGLLLLLNKDARKKAEQKAQEYILKAEYEAEQYALKTGKDKFDWVVDSAYPLLPARVRIFVSKELFKTIVQYVFDFAIDWAEENAKRNPEPSPAPSPAPAVTPAQPAEQPAQPVADAQPAQPQQ